MASDRTVDPGVAYRHAGKAGQREGERAKEASAAGVVETHGLRRVRVHSGALAGLAAISLIGATGCPRIVTVKQTDYVNTAMHGDRPSEQRTGEPLELTIVCVLPKDLENPANKLLKPDSNLTSADWYEYRPKRGDTADMKESHTRFRIADSQIYLLTNETGLYGNVIGTALNGGKIDGKEKSITKSDVAYPLLPIHDSQAVIYVFGKFRGPDRKVLPIAPAKFNPPGAYEERISVEVGVDKSREESPPDYGQYIRNITKRKMHGADK